MFADEHLKSERGEEKRREEERIESHSTQPVSERDHMNTLSSGKVVALC